MFPRRRSTPRTSGGRLALLSCLVLTLGAPGCATLVEGRTQRVQVITNPRGGKVTYQGLEVKDGDFIFIHRQQDPPHVEVNGVPVQLEYDPSPWLLADAGLLVIYIVPGLVALGVDFFTGCWRHFSEPAVVYVPSAKTK